LGEGVQLYIGADDYAGTLRGHTSRHTQKTHMLVHLAHAHTRHLHDVSGRWSCWYTYTTAISRRRHHTSFVVYTYTTAISRRRHHTSFVVYTYTTAISRRRHHTSFVVYTYTTSRPGTISIYLQSVYTYNQYIPTISIPTISIYLQLVYTYN
jgi:hypothetical protein